MEEKTVVFAFKLPLNYKDEQTFIEMDGIKFCKCSNLTGFAEIFSRRDYEFGGLDNCVFIDVGANIADSTLYAAKQPHIANIYAYEPFYHTYKLALDNISLNPDIFNKIELFNFGWSNKNEQIDVSCVNDINHSAVNSIEDFFKKDVVRERDYITKITVKKSSDVFREIKQKHPNQPIILKMDIEGAEYNCFNDLQENNLIKDIDAIFVEWHLKGKEPITKILDKNDFIWFNEGLSRNTGFLRAYNKKKNYSL